MVNFEMYLLILGLAGDYPTNFGLLLGSIEVVPLLNTHRLIWSDSLNYAKNYIIL